MQNMMRRRGDRESGWEEKRRRMDRKGMRVNYLRLNKGQGVTFVMYTLGERKEVWLL